jgi:predicted HTH transcriptional regulator
MSSQDLCELILVGEEKRNLEYKAPMRWDNDLTKAKITKTILAMSNIRDGGWIVIGVNQLPNGTFERVGLTEEESNTFNHDDIAPFINGYADPYVKLHVYQVSCENKRYVIMKVDEFEEFPVICKKEYPLADLHQGKMYIRSTRKNENSEVSTLIEMKEIIELAVDKNMRAFFGRLQRVGMISKGVVSNDEEAFRNQIGDLK